MRRALTRAVFGLAAMAAVPGMALAQQDYPNRSIRLVVPFAPGGGADLAARKIGEALAKRLGQPIVIDNRAGAGGRLGAQAVASGADVEQDTILKHRQD